MLALRAEVGVAEDTASVVRVPMVDQLMELDDYALAADEDFNGAIELERLLADGLPKDLVKSATSNRKNRRGDKVAVVENH